MLLASSALRLCDAMPWIAAILVIALAESIVLLIGRFVLAIGDVECLDPKELYSKLAKLDEESAMASLIVGAAKFLQTQHTAYHYSSMELCSCSCVSSVCEVDCICSVGGIRLFMLPGLNSSIVGCPPPSSASVSCLGIDSPHFKSCRHAENTRRIRPTPPTLYHIAFLTSPYQK